MRASSIFRFLSVAAMVVAVVIWFLERSTAVDLQSRFAAVRKQEQQVGRLRAERDRLREKLRVVAMRPSGSRAVPANRETRQPDVPVAAAAFAIGTWTSATAWRNEGQSTPRSTISTLLWAAAGGDLAAIQNILEFGDDARNKARAWFETLPPATRSLYATPEDLVASVTMGNIPPTTAQLTWFHQTDAGHAVVGVMLAGPVSSVPESASTVEPSVGNAPPFLSRQSPNRLAVLNLHNTPGGWRVIVPAPAIDGMAKIMRSTTAR
ncbi:MAG TPA: hypothetical protein VGM64_09675 [Lacunisphaera sp.]